MVSTSGSFLEFLAQDGVWPGSKSQINPFYPSCFWSECFNHRDKKEKVEQPKRLHWGVQKKGVHCCPIPSSGCWHKFHTQKKNQGRRYEQLSILSLLWMCESACLYVHMCAWKLAVNFKCLLQLLCHLEFSNRVSCWSWNFFELLEDWLDSQLRGFISLSLSLPVSFCLFPHYRHSLPCLDFYLTDRYTNSGFCASPASTLPTETSPQP